MRFSPTSLLALFLSAASLHCGLNSDSRADNAPTPSGSMTDVFSCAETPVAYVLTADPQASLAQSAAQALLAEAGFDVEPLPLDRSPEFLRGLIFIESYASTSEDYADYMERFAADLYRFVDRANVLVQLAQDPMIEPSPPFLPTTQGATRATASIMNAYVVSDSSELTMGVEVHNDGLLPWSEPMGFWPFAEQSGFGVTMAGSANGESPVLLEGAYGQGRIVLAGLSLDQPASDAAAESFAQTFFANLAVHVDAVCRRDTRALNVSIQTAAEAFTPGSFKLAVLPDTQVYSLRYPGLFTTQTQWIASNAATFDIRYVIQLGDIVNNNTDVEWQRAAAAMSLLDGVVPYALVPGNHDYGPSGDASTRDTKLNDYFDFERTASLPSFGGAFEEGQLENTYHLFSASGRDFIIMALEWGPRDEVIDWAHQIMDGFPDRDGIFVTHAYLNNTNLRYDYTDTEHAQDFNPHQYATPGGVNDGEELWQKLIRHHRFVMTLSGHVLGSGVGYLVSTTDTGTSCHQMLSNYQMRELGGEAYMRLIEFLPDGHTVRVLTYSPLYDSFMTEADQSFTLALD